MLYPKQLERWMTWPQGSDQRILVRPIRPDDGARHLAFFAQLDPTDIRARAFMHVRELSAETISRLVEIDYDLHMAFVAVREIAQESETLGVVRSVRTPDNASAEFAIIVRSDLKGKGLGPLLLETLITYQRSIGTLELVGDALSTNTEMLQLARRFDFQLSSADDPGVMQMRLPLQPVPAPTPTPVTKKPAKSFTRVRVIKRKSTLRSP
jgi:acetyltransferase